MGLKFDPNFLHVISNVQSTGNIISFRIYDTYFQHDVRGHGAGLTLPRSMCVDFFCQFLSEFFLFFSLSLSFYFPFNCAFYLIVLFWPCLLAETSRAFEKRQGQSRFSELNFSIFFGGEAGYLKASGVLQVCV